MKKLRLNKFQRDKNLILNFFTKNLIKSQNFNLTFIET